MTQVPQPGERLPSEEALKNGAKRNPRSPDKRRAMVEMDPSQREGASNDLGCAQLEDLV
jgi:hypothetical protein